MCNTCKKHNREEKAEKRIFRAIEKDMKKLDMIHKKY